MKKFTILLVVCLFLFINQANTQTWTTYSTATTSSALCNNIVRAIVIDTEGNKWFGTYDGVSKFDGNTWTTYTTADGLADNHVTAIAIDLEGNKWFGYGDVERGVSKFNDTTWTTYTTSDGLASNYVNAIAIDVEGNKWFGSPYEGVSKFDGTTWTTYTTDDGLACNDVHAIAIDVDGNKWFGTGVGVSKFDDTTWTTYTEANGLASNWVLAITVDAQGNKWFGTGVGVSKFDDTTWTTYTTADGLASNNVYAIAIDAEGNKWFGCTPYYDDVQQAYIGGGVSKFDGNTWTTYTTAVGLADNHVTAISIDLEGNKWFGYGDVERGVSKFNDTTWTTYTTSDGLASNYVNAIAIDVEGNKWFGTYEGVSKFDGTIWTTYTTADGLVSNSVTLIAIDLEGNKWFGYGDFVGDEGGVTKFDGTNWTTYTSADGLISNRVLAIAIDAEGNKWFGAREGVSKFDGTNWTNYYTLPWVGLGYPHPRYYVAIDADAEGNIWFGWMCRDEGWYDNGGIVKFDGTTWTICDSARRVESVAIDAEGNKWFGTERNGVSKFNDTIWIDYDVGWHIRAIAIDSEGGKWFGSYGLTKLDDNNCLTHSSLNDNSVYAIAIDAEGNKWFATGGGVMKLSDDLGSSYISFYPINLNVVSDSGSATFSISSDTSWSIDYYSDWLTVNPTNGNNNGTITVNFTTNNSISSRVANIYIYSENLYSGTSIVTVIQEGIEELSVSPINQDVSYEAGDTTFSISSTTDWYVSDDADWLEASPTSGSGDGTITATYTANTLRTPRVATITIYGPGINVHSVTVTQSGVVNVPSLYDHNVVIYPNPVKDNLFMKFKDAPSTDFSIFLVDVSGRLIIQRNFMHIDLNEEKALDLSSVKRGIYFLEIRSEKNSRVYKIIKE